ncbi:hypothetical protein [Escherichia coli]|uniref:hypothetical protein n=1 Tax=Escherichia coli TaxID=562 RepID=UPI00145E8151|nr:hypothetical protein [Escherichia coli]EHZ1177760.1 hypothetical protein [Salmonella enterica]HBR9780562.1 hypothetical protein [Klebsiella pneumoniae]EGE0523617.1 hypothetical protein [Escherichia coli]EHK0837089.1 hypothetical protein [Escherichia coli]EJP1045007.1 hypothetical protein [Escherichia coli]
MSSSAAITVLTGIAVFVIGQLISKRFIEPYISFREQLGRISALLLREQATITNFNATSETIHELKDAAAQLMAKYSALPTSLKRGYVGIKFVPSKAEVLGAAQNLNEITSILAGNSKENTSNLIKETGVMLNIPTTYSH